jgi:hypothetical protein
MNAWPAARQNMVIVVCWENGGDVEYLLLTVAAFQWVVTTIRWVREGVGVIQGDMAPEGGDFLGYLLCPSSKGPLSGSLLLVCSRLDHVQSSYWRARACFECFLLDCCVCDSFMFHW